MTKLGLSGGFDREVGAVNLTVFDTGDGNLSLT